MVLVRIDAGRPPVEAVRRWRGSAAVPDSGIGGATLPGASRSGAADAEFDTSIATCSSILGAEVLTGSEF